jgi:hypothetical protein
MKNKAAQELARLSVLSPKRTKEYYQNLSRLGVEARKRKAKEEKQS